MKRQRKTHRNKANKRREKQSLKQARQNELTKIIYNVFILKVYMVRLSECCCEDCK